MGQFALLARSPIGIFVFSEEGELIYFRLASRNPTNAFEEFSKFKETEVRSVVKKDLVESDTGYAFLRKNFRDYAKSLGFAESDEEVNKFLSEFSCQLSKKRLQGVIGKDRLVIQAANALNDITKTSNLFQERLYEWFSLHYPEIDAKNLVENIINYGRRDNFPGFRGSSGVDIAEKDEEVLVEFAASIQSMLEQKERLEKYVKDAMKEIAPNVSSIVDPLLAAKLIALAGSLEKLARMPASTIQLLGSEKALFRHLHKKGKPPKHGILFTSSIIKNAGPDKKGKAARILASKLMMAARIDFYSGRIEERLRKDLEEELKSL
ncbi:hypothetical protein HY501_03345, partial [Candidatus Woesearchaeota archaeon]|nr:hypothetical protein [Candidatus Woesearchaeota archaeon]